MSESGQGGLVPLRHAGPEADHLHRQGPGGGGPHVSQDGIADQVNGPPLRKRSERDNCKASIFHASKDVKKVVK